MLESLRTNRRLRTLAAHLPISRLYEQRIAELHDEIADLQKAVGPFPPGHYYSPIPDVNSLAAATDLFNVDPANVPGVKLNLDGQWQLWNALLPLVSKFQFPETAEPGYRYFLKNDWYVYGDGLGLFLMLLHLRPSRYFEIGSGFSSALVADVRDRYFDGDLEMTLVEPHTERLESLLTNQDLRQIRLLRMTAQEVPIVEFNKLEAGDVLFIDSTHVLKAGSDVNHELFQILPMLQRGVVVHFHDIHPGFEYLRESVLAGIAWNEAYAVRAFMQFNTEFEVLLWPKLLWTIDRQRVERDWPLMAKNPGGALWLIRR
jgi:hypothetical protein